MKESKVRGHIFAGRLGDVRLGAGKDRAPQKFFRYPSANFLTISVQLGKRKP